MSADENKTIIRAFLTEVWNNGDLSVVDEFLAEDYVGHDPSFPGGVMQGRDTLKGYLQQLRAAVPDARITIEDVIAEGDRTAVRLTVTGTHTGGALGLAASGREINVSGMLVSRFAGARIVEEWAIRDMLGLLQQIGAIPMPEAAPAGV